MESDRGCFHKLEEGSLPEYMATLPRWLQPFCCMNAFWTTNHTVHENPDQQKPVREQSKEKLATSKCSLGLLILPVELHQDIISHLAYAAEPGIFDLRNSNGYFLSIVRTADM